MSSDTLTVVKKGMYLTDGERLYYVIKVAKDKKFATIENCFTTNSHTRDMLTVSKWLEVIIE